MSVLTANVGSWRTMEEWILKRSEDVILLQETRLTATSLPAARAAAARAGWQGAWGAAAPSTHGPASGGLAVLCRSPRRCQAVPHAGEHAERWLHAVVELAAGKPLHVFCLYGFDSGQPQAARRNAALFREVLEAAVSLGEVPWVAGGDWNTLAADVWELVADEGRQLFLPRAACDTWGTCRPAGRRIDYFVMGASLAGKTSVERVLREDPLWPHHPVQVEISGRGRPAPTPILDTPAAFLDGGSDLPIGPRPDGASVWDACSAAWELAEADGDLDALWTIWSAAGETWFSGWTGKDAARFRGRGRERRRIMAPPRKVGVELPSGAATGSSCDWLHVWRWLRELRRQVCSESDGAPTRAAHLFALLGPAMRRLRAPPAAAALAPGTLPWPDRAEQLLGASLTDLAAWEEEAEAAFRASQTASASARRDSWRAWVRDCIRRRPGLLYRWLRGDTEPVLAGIHDGAGWTLSPSAIAEHARAAWAKFWCPPDGPGPWLSRAPEGPELPPLQGPVLHGIVRAVSARAAAGVDGWRARELKELPPVFWDRLAVLLHLCERVGRWPRPLRAGMVALLPKAGKQDPAEMRPIAVLPLVYRIWAAARRPWVRRWVTGPGADGAELHGLGAADAAWDLALEAEAVQLQGDSTAICAVFLDCSKCYERVPHQELERRAREAQFPDRLLVLALHMYSGPRFVRVGKAFAEPVWASSGIMAGCGMAGALLRAHMRPAVLTSVPQPAAWRVRRYVDDVVVWARGAAAAAAHWVCCAFRHMEDQLHLAGMQLNREKTGMVASTPAAVAAARQAAEGLDLAVVDTVRDLGIDVSWGRRRQTTRKQRRRRAEDQAARLQRLPAGPAFRAQAAAALLVSASTYGTAVDGLTPSAASSLRRAVQQALHHGHRARRAVEADLAFFGDSRRLDPAEAAALAAVLTWARRAPEWPSGMASLEDPWRASMAAEQRHPRGPIAATQLALKRLRWTASGPLEWTDALGVAVPLGDQAQLRELVHRDFRADEWRKVSTRRADFEGAAAGIDEEVSGQLVRRMLRRGRDKLAGGLLCVLSGGTWPLTRRFRAGFAASPECPRCGAPEESVLHRWWVCPAFAEARRQHGVEDLARQGAATGFTPACVWQLGLVPSAATAVPPSADMRAEDEQPEACIPELAHAAEPVQACTDGSAIHAAVPSICRAGWGLWVHGCPDASGHSPLRGPAQTAQRAELRAFVAALERTAGNVHVWTDSMFVVRGAGFLDAGVVPPLRHADLWERAHRAWRPGTTRAQWIKAHLDWQEASQRGFTWQAWAGNKQADELAGRGSQAHAPPDSDVQRVLRVCEDAERAQLWMVAALGLAADAGPPSSAPQSRRRRCRPGQQRRPRELQRGPPGDHPDVQRHGDHWRCTVCSRQVKVSRGWREWRRVPCQPGRPPFPPFGAALPSGMVPAGRTAHILETAGGRTACVLCGRSRLTRWRTQLGRLCPSNAG